MLLTVILFPDSPVLQATAFTGCYVVGALAGLFTAGDPAPVTAVLQLPLVVPESQPLQSLLGCLVPVDHDVGKGREGDPAVGAPRDAPQTVPRLHHPDRRVRPDGERAEVFLWLGLSYAGLGNFESASPLSTAPFPLKSPEANGSTTPGASSCDAKATAP